MNVFIVLAKHKKSGLVEVVNVFSDAAMAEHIIFTNNHVEDSKLFMFLVVKKLSYEQYTEE